MALAKYGVHHSIMAPPATVRWIVAYHMAELGRSWFDPNAQTVVAGVNTLLRRAPSLQSWCARVGLWVIDEAHHCAGGNQWQQATELFPNARGLGVTATPCRADGLGLGRHADGVMDTMVQGPSMRDLINLGFLCGYRIFAPPSDINLAEVNITRSGDYSPKQLTAAARKSRIVGDVVEHYRRIAPGKLGVTFVTDVETAKDVAARYLGAGVPAAVVTAKTPGPERVSIMRKFKRRELLQLVNVDLFGEGTDIPALEVVSMARPTQSYGLFVQQFGRVMRIMEGKQHGTIIDHVGNVQRHGLPDARRAWTLDRRERSAKGKRDPDLIPVTTCRKCTAVFPALGKQCPACGYINEPTDRSGPEQVAGDLTELDPATLAAMRGEVDRLMSSDEAVRARMQHAGAPGIAIAGAAKQHRLRREAQTHLRLAVSYWAGAARAAGQPDSESYKRFYYRYGVDVMTAQTLGRRDAETLTTKIWGDIHGRQQI